MGGPIVRPSYGGAVKVLLFYQRVDRLACGGVVVMERGGGGGNYFVVCIEGW